MIFIVKDVHDEQRDRVSEVSVALYKFTLRLPGNRKTCDEYPYESAKLKR